MDASAGVTKLLPTATRRDESRARAGLRVREMEVMTVKQWREQRNEAAARRRTMLFQAPEPAIREPVTSVADSSRSPRDWVEWVERHNEADREQALMQVPATCRHAVAHYLWMKGQRELFEHQLATRRKNR